MNGDREKNSTFTSRTRHLLIHSEIFLLVFVFQDIVCECVTTLNWHRFG